MKPNAVYYYITSLAYIGVGLYIYFAKINSSWLKPQFKIWFTIIMICLGIYRAIRGYQLQKSHRKN